MALPCKEHRNGRTANVQLLCRRSCGLFQKKKNDAAAVMRSRCALEKLCARSEKQLSKRELPDTVVNRMKIVTDLNIV